MTKYAKQIVSFIAGETHNIYVDFEDIMEISAIVKLLKLDCYLEKTKDNRYRYTRDISDIHKFLLTGDATLLKPASVTILRKYACSIGI